MHLIITRANNSLPEIRAPGWGEVVQKKAVLRAEAREAIEGSFAGLNLEHFPAR